MKSSKSHNSLASFILVKLQIVLINFMKLQLLDLKGLFDLNAAKFSAQLSYEIYFL